jgi:hypothetical protein
MRGFPACEGSSSKENLFNNPYLLAAVDFFDSLVSAWFNNFNSLERFLPVLEGKVKGKGKISRNLCKGEIEYTGDNRMYIMFKMNCYKLLFKLK